MRNSLLPSDRLPGGRFHTTHGEVEKRAHSQATKCMQQSVEGMFYSKRGRPEEPPLQETCNMENKKKQEILKMTVITEINQRQ